jgi:hypothetical protein
MMTETQATRITEILKAAIDARLAWQELPTQFIKTRNGWAAYKGNTRITRFVFSEETARELAIQWEASDVRVQF